MAKTGSRIPMVRFSRGPKAYSRLFKVKQAYSRVFWEKEDCLKCVPPATNHQRTRFCPALAIGKGSVPLCGILGPRPALRERPRRMLLCACCYRASEAFKSLRKVPGGGHLPAFAGLCQLPPAGPGLHGLAHWIPGIWHFSGAWMLEFGPFPPPSAHPALTLRVPFAYPNCTLRQPLPAKQHSREKYARYSHLKNYKSLAQTTCKSRKSNLLGPKTPRKRAIFRNIFCRNSASLGT